MPLAQAVSGGGSGFGICAENLQNQFAKEETFKLIQGDILELDIQAALEQDKEYNFGLPNKVVANIPYYITGPILEKLLGTIANPNPAPYDSIVLLVQKEVAERLYAKPGNRAFGALSVRVQYLADCEQICQVPAKAFQPPPKVGFCRSAVAAQASSGCSPKSRSPGSAGKAGIFQQAQDVNAIILRQ